jgi:hypothetical protein
LNTTDWVGALSLGILIGSMLVWIAALTIAYTQMDGALQIMGEGSNRHKRAATLQGPIGKVRLMAEITGIALFPKSAIKLKIATKAEIDSIPASFKRNLAIIFYLQITLLSSASLLIALEGYLGH